MTFALITVCQGSRLAVSRYPRDTGFQFCILDIICLVSRWDTTKIEILAKFIHRGEMFVKIIFFRCLLRENGMDLSTRLISASLFSATIAQNMIINDYAQFPVAIVT
jgi:hypothetical protein